jgi:hypothetical protein
MAHKHTRCKTEAATCASIFAKQGLGDLRSPAPGAGAQGRFSEQERADSHDELTSTPSSSATSASQTLSISSSVHTLLPPQIPALPLHMLSLSDSHSEMSPRCIAFSEFSPRPSSHASLYKDPGAPCPRVFRQAPVPTSPRPRSPEGPYPKTPRPFVRSVGKAGWKSAQSEDGKGPELACSRLRGKRLELPVRGLEGED